MSVEKGKEHLIQFLGDIIFDLSDEEIRTVAKNVDVDISEGHAEFVAEMLSLADDADRRRLAGLREMRLSRLSELNGLTFRDLFPGKDPRAILAEVLHSNPHIAQGLTVQFREVKDLSDDDVAGILTQLVVLGALEGLDSEDSE